MASSSGGRQALTHFLAIPLAASPAARAQLSRSVAAFRADATAPHASGGFGFPADAVRPPGTLHLTLGVMSLSGGGGGEGEEGGGGGSLAKAVALLRSLELKEMLAAARAGGGGGGGGAGEEGPLVVRLRGLRTMRDGDAARAAVMYAAPGPEQPLGRFCEGVLAAFVREGLVRDEGRPLLLHATVVNTVYCKGSGKRGGGRGGKRGGGGGGGRMTLDARGALERYADYDWAGGADIVLDRLAIYRFGAKGVRRDNGGGEGMEEDAAYEVVAEVEI
ncbi:hypothetical protein GGTG_12931 [Gaeumannomyces tritici R3-111a-1]|uniref:A-kinase anchor protein 7-like phosphoesterase domain-containing protein n=1 Tax=Gaeumannomyces tritici (strain R3-111a-1) TaxID=644352 RepID=J3PHF2_GAET3|nr:hypothetical protein GGTG_12931 [Gaeumannomyces tritici R3-111a-1]EJT69312.1 hypothetical protein GGTG_12931 [Gaeumannomyces tritici R3-111a-1]